MLAKLELNRLVRNARDLELLDKKKKKKKKKNTIFLKTILRHFVRRFCTETIV